MHEKGIADRFHEHIYDMSPGGEQRQWPQLKMNPRGETPTLQLADGSFIAETDAIVRYLDPTYPGRRIMGETPLQQGLDTMWTDRIRPPKRRARVGQSRQLKAIRAAGAKAPRGD